MRDNVSIIFATIFAVLLLIIFPLFSLLTRQDSIAYNKVLTLTTEFVDSIRTKGYFTEKEYTDYLFELANTNNTYKVEMECHKKLLIKDVDKYTNENPIWVEDTAVYYNSYIIDELENSQVLSLEEGDEFYIKIYNTNITTASLIYNFFLGSGIQNKIINIGYGGKILNNTGNAYEKTSFNSSYTPYIVFEEVVNNSGENFKQCYDEEAGTYEMQSCVRVIDIDKEENIPLNVKFKLYNFKKIGDRDVNSTTFDENKTYFAEMIKEQAVLRGDYISSYNIEVSDLKLISGYVEGTVKVRDISMNSDAWRTTAYIVIASNLGIGSTGASSSEGTTDELILTQKELIAVDGPYLSKNTTEVITETLKNNEQVYYKVTMKNSNGISKLELYDTANSKTLATYTTFDKELVSEDYKVNVDKISSSSNTEEYWISVTPTFDFDASSMFVNVEKELQLVVYRNAESKSVSKVAMWSSLMLDIKCDSVDKSSNDKLQLVKIQFASETDEDINEYLSAQGKTAVEFFQELVDNNVIYLSKDSSSKVPDSQFKIKITTANNITIGTSAWNITYMYDETYISGAPKSQKLYFNLKDSTESVKSYSFNEYINIPSGYTFELKDGLMTISKEQDVYYWLPVTEEDIGTNGYYDDNVTEARIRESISKYGGVYVAQNIKQAGNFYDTWNWATSLEHDELFSSLVYEWQLAQVIDSFGDNAQIGSNSSNARFWVAANVNSDYAKAALLNSSGKYTYSSIEKSKTADNSGVNIRGLRVLYIK